MHRLRPLMFIFLLGVITNCVSYAQPPSYPPSQGSDSYGNTYRGNDGYGDDNEYYQDDGYGYDHGDYDGGYDDSPTAQVDVGFFYDELSPYGDWVHTRSYGWAWFPRNVHPYWRPYVDGRWVTTDYGWTWVSQEPFGWATYHYGRWTWDPRFGWLWIPGTEWGPAWVSWQSGGGYIGWAPLPPAVGFEVGVGIRLGNFNLSIGIRPNAYSFVSERSFLEPRLSRHLIPTARNVTIIHHTTNVTNYTYVENRVVNRGVDVGRIERATGRAVQRRHLAESRDRTRSEVATNEVRMYRPERQRLDTVRQAPRHRTDPRVTTPSTTRTSTPATGSVRQPRAAQRPPNEVEVAPRAGRVPREDARQIDRREQREKQELVQHQNNEKNKLERLHRQEVAKAREQADRAEVKKHQDAERAAMQREQKDASKRLTARQEAQRRAEMKAAADKASADAAKKNNGKKDDGKGRGSGKDKDKKDNGRGHGDGKGDGKGDGTP